MTVEMYGLFDPDTRGLRYIGKAKDSAKRLKSHIAESRTCNRPVNLWIRHLIAQSKLPILTVIATVPESEWKAAERFLIAEARKTDDLLNLAPGGDMPSCTREQRAANARKANATIAKQDPRWRRFCDAKRDIARQVTKMKKRGDVMDAYALLFRMRARAIEKPHLFPEWLEIH